MGGIIVAAGVAGTLVGSFLNVVVARVPEGRSVVRPRSACPNCGHAITARDNVPIVSWMLLRARCRSCGTPISARYPLVELGTALAFIGVVSGSVASAPEALLASTPVLLGWLLQTIALLVLAGASIALALIDLDVHRLPDRIVLPLYPVTAVLLTGSALLLQQPERLAGAALGGAGLFLGYLAMALIKPGGMGLGDVKLSGVLGLVLGWLGWQQLAVGVFLPFLLGGLFAIALIIARRASRASRVPFGPWMLVGAWIGIAAGPPLITSYLALFGLR